MFDTGLFQTLTFDISKLNSDIDIGNLSILTLTLKFCLDIFKIVTFEITDFEILTFHWTPLSRAQKVGPYLGGGAWTLLQERK